MGQGEVIYVVAGNRHLARAWARENQKPPSGWRYIHCEHDLRGLRKDQVKVADPLFLETDSFWDRVRKEDIAKALEAML